MESVPENKYNMQHRFNFYHHQTQQHPQQELGLIKTNALKSL